MLPKLYEICAKKVRCYIHMHLVVDIPKIYLVPKKSAMAKIVEISKYILCQKKYAMSLIFLKHLNMFCAIKGDKYICIWL